MEPKEKIAFGYFEMFPTSLNLAIYRCGCGVVYGRRIALHILSMTRAVPLMSVSKYSLW